MSQSSLMRLAGYGITGKWPIFEIKMMICQSKANLDVKILFGRIPCHLNPVIREMLVRGFHGHESSNFDSSLLTKLKKNRHLF